MEFCLPLCRSPLVVPIGSCLRVKGDLVLNGYQTISIDRSIPTDSHFFETDWVEDNDSKIQTDVCLNLRSVWIWIGWDWDNEKEWWQLKKYQELHKQITRVSVRLLKISLMLLIHSQDTTNSLQLQSRGASDNEHETELNTYSVEIVAQLTGFSLVTTYFSDE
jgi:hypothetical protein